MAQWLDYEKMIARIYEELNPAATMTHNYKVVGRLSRIPRQIDVAIRAKVEEQDLFVAVQAKAYKKPADVNDVGEFATVLQDVSATKGVIICNRGFTEGAFNLAQSLGIDLCSAHDAENRNWNDDLHIPVLWIDYSPTVELQFQIHLDAGDWIPEDPQAWVFSTDKGLTRLTIFKTFVEAWNTNRIPKDPNSRHSLIPTNEGVELFVRGEKWQPVDGLILAYTVEEQAWLKYFAPVEFRGIKSYITGEIDFSRLRLGIVPFKVDDNWVAVTQPDQFIVETKGLLVTSSSLTISIDGVRTFSAYLHLLEKDAVE